MPTAENESVPLLRLLLAHGLVVLGRERLADFLAESLFQKPAGLLAFGPGEALRLDAGFSGGRDDDLDRFQAAPPIWIVSLIEPSVSSCSVTVCPLRRASMQAFSTA